MTADANCNAINGQLAACAAQLGGGVATCEAGSTAGLAVVDHNGQRFLSFRFPDTHAKCSGGANTGKLCTQPSDCPGGSCVAGDDDHTLAGPAAIAVTQPGDPLPCDLASTPCANQTGLVACVDDYFANDGACGTAVPLGTFPHFTALPPPNNYQAACFTGNATSDPPGPCNPTAPDLRFGVDTAGNLLLPVNWQGVLIPSAVPVPRLLRTRFLSPLPFSIPDAVFAGLVHPRRRQAAADLRAAARSQRVEPERRLPLWLGGRPVHDSAHRTALRHLSGRRERRPAVQRQRGLPGWNLPDDVRR